MAEKRNRDRINESRDNSRNTRSDNRQKVGNRNSGLKNEERDLQHGSRRNAETDRGRMNIEDFEE